MSQSLNIVHLPGSTIKVENEIRDFPAFGEEQGQLMDPDSHVIMITDPEGADQTGTISVLGGDPNVGQFWFFYTIPVDGIKGTWVVEWKAVTGPYSGKKSGTFEVGKTTITT